MEYCGGGELFNYIVNNRRLSEDESSFFFYQIINGLESIHKYNIAHRDLKPENILMTDSKLVKLIDFGLSNTYTEGNLLSTPCGSPCYASPEMVAGKSYDGFMIDVWSTGIVLYAMICGFLPFEDSNNDKLFEKILECRVHFPSFVPSNVKDIIKKMLVPNPDKRIKIHEIKHHPFYIQGKNLLEKLFNPKIEKISSKSGKKTNLTINKNSILENINFSNTPEMSPKQINTSSDNRNKVLTFPNKNNYIKLITSSKSKPKKTEYISNILNSSVEKNYLLTDEKKTKVNPFNITNFNSAFNNFKNFPGVNKIKLKSTFRDTIDIAKLYLNTTTNTRINTFSVDKRKLIDKKPKNKFNVYNITNLKLKEKVKAVLLTKN
jgi:5'-AMP-activated protein kinase catalytic alpha subunit